LVIAILIGPVTFPLRGSFPRCTAHESAGKESTYIAVFTPLASATRADHGSSIVALILASPDRDRGPAIRPSEPVFRGGCYESRDPARFE
jgi:hypothetical protein